MTADPTERFSTRVESYSRYRPGYPEKLPTLLEDSSSRVPGDVLVELGSGTGRLTELLPTRGYPVFAVEPNGPMRVVAIWNVRDRDNDAFMADYEALLAEHGTGYRNVGEHGIADAERRRIFGSDRVLFHRLPNEQRLDRNGLIGRVLSASYAPEPGHPGYEAMVSALDTLFGKYQCGGELVLRYRTEVYHGPLCREC